MAAALRCGLCDCALVTDRHQGDQNGKMNEKTTGVEGGAGESEVGRLLLALLHRRHDDDDGVRFLKCLECSDSPAVCPGCFSSETDSEKPKTQSQSGQQTRCGHARSAFWCGRYALGHEQACDVLAGTAPSGVHEDVESNPDAVAIGADTNNVAVQEWRESVADTLARAFFLYGERPCLGVVRGAKIKAKESGGDNQEKATEAATPRLAFQDFGELSSAGIDWMSYAEVWRLSGAFRRAMAVAAGERAETTPEEKGKKAQSWAIVSGVRPEWVCADLACLTGGMTSVILHSGVGSSEGGSSDNDVANEQLRRQLEWCDGVVCGRAEERAVRAVAEEKLAVVVMEDVVATYFSNTEEKERGTDFGVVPAPSASETVSIVLTSGTSGPSKGLKLSDRWFNNFIRNCWPYDPLVCLLGFMPWSHQTGRMMTYTLFFNGGRGLLHSGDIEQIFEEFQLANPSMMVSAPRLYDLLLSDFRRDTANCDTAAVARVREQYARTFGNRMQCICTGGASTSVTTLSFLRDTFAGVLVADGYGASECGAIAINNTLAPKVEAKLAPADGFDLENGYGELLVKTPTMSAGYIGSDTPIVDAEGWYHTGDVVFFEPATKRIELIDRCSNVTKLAQGEFVALQRLEAIYSASPLVSQICVHGDSYMTAVAAIVVPKKAAKSHTASEILHDLRRLGREANFASFEVPSVVLLAEEAFEEANGLLTPSHKIKRRAIVLKYGAQLEQLASEEYPDVPEQPPASQDTDAVVLDLAGIFSRVTRTPQSCIDPKMSFVALGGDSLAAVMFARLVSKRYSAPSLTASFLVESQASLLALAQKIGRTSENGESADEEEKEENEENELDFSAEVEAVFREYVQDLDSRPAAADDAQKIPKKVLVTGATGFLGSEVLRTALELWPKTTEILVLVRRPDVALNSDRVTPVIGNVASVNFGLDGGTYKELTSEVDTVIHIAADTNSFGHYKDVRGVNVVGTARVLRFCLEGDVGKRLAHVSTAGVLPAPQAGKNWERDALGDMDHAELRARNGYTQSKWIAERLVHVTSERKGVATLVFRPGMIAGSLTTGRVNKGDWVYRWVAGCLRVNLFPPIDDPATVQLDWVPVDFCARAIISLITKPGAYHHAGGIHLVNAEHPTGLHSAAQLFGLDPKSAVADSYDAWLQRVLSDDGNPILPMLPLFESGFPRISTKWTNADTISLLAGDTATLGLLRAITAADCGRWRQALVV